jgi:hypothetical protein
MPMDSKNTRALYGRVEQATANPGEKRDLSECRAHLDGATVVCSLPAGHEGRHWTIVEWT